MGHDSGQPLERAVDLWPLPPISLNNGGVASVFCEIRASVFCSERDISLGCAIISLFMDEGDERLLADDRQLVTGVELRPWCCKATAR
jgi:methylaspartate ammonia-lyase